MDDIMIPKTIHYCWFGRSPKPKLVKRCIKSWKKYCKDYKIIEWNEDNYDIDAAPLYVRQAYEQKKWAFVSDYARYDILYRFGGVYLDTDVEVIKNLDKIIEQGAYMGCEADGDMLAGRRIMVSSGLGMAAPAGLPVFKEILDSYENDVFVYPDGSLNYTTVVIRETNILLGRGLKNTNTVQTVAGIKIYPKEYFCPRNGYGGKVCKTENTYTVHHFVASWATKQMRKGWTGGKKKKLPKYRFKILVDRFIHLPNIVAKKILGEQKYENLKKKIKG